MRDENILILNTSTMLKKFAALFCALSVAFAFTSCEPNEVEKTKLSKPNPELGNKTETSFTVTWKAVTNADSYIYTFDGGAEKTTTETSVSFEGLTVGVEYTVAIKSHSNDTEKFEDSDFSTFKITLQEQAAPTPGNTDWVGTWTVTAEMGLGWQVTEDNYLEAIGIEGPITRTITIEDASEDAGQEGVYYIYGYSELGAQIPTLGMYDAENDGIIIYTGLAVGEASQGYTPTWATLLTDGEGGIDWTFEETYPSFLLAFNEGSTTEATAWGGQNQLEDGTVVYSYGLDVYGLDAAGEWVIYVLDEAGTLPTTLLGNTSWVKQGTKADFAVVSDWNFVPRFGHFKANL